MLGRTNNPNHRLPIFAPWTNITPHSLGAYMTNRYAQWIAKCNADLLHCPFMCLAEPMAANETPEASPSSVGSSTSMVTLESSAFFTEQRAPNLPSPVEIRALAALPNGGDFSFSLSRPRPVIIPSLGLLIKYGNKVTVAEAETQCLVHRRLQNQVPIPEVYGWAEDGDQVFIYMELVEGDALQDRWSTMNEDERTSVCAELKSMVAAWRAMPQEDGEKYIGSVGKKPLNEIFIRDRPELKGAYMGSDAVRQFHETCDIEISYEEPIVFTHNDLCPPNIMITHGRSPRVAAIIDWAQSGWLPSYWESCKARRVCGPGEELSSEQQEEWWTKYLPLIMDFVEDEIYHSFIYFQMSKM